MDDVLVAEVLRKLSLVTSTVGIIVGIDLIFGAKVLLTVKKVLDKAYNFDNAVTRPKIRLWVGVFILFVSALMMLLLATTK